MTDTVNRKRAFGRCSTPEYSSSALDALAGAISRDWQIAAPLNCAIRSCRVSFPSAARLVFLSRRSRALLRATRVATISRGANRRIRESRAIAIALSRNFGRARERASRPFPPLLPPLSLSPGYFSLRGDSGDSVPPGTRVRYYREACNFAPVVTRRAGTKRRARARSMAARRTRRTLVDRAGMLIGRH